MAEWTASQIKELIDVQICAERRHRDALRIEDRRSFETSVATVEKALQLQATEYERRLADLNHAHAQAKDALETYIPREIFERINRENNEWRRMMELHLGEIEQRLKSAEMVLINVPSGIKSLEIEQATNIGEHKRSLTTVTTSISIASILIALIAAVVGWLAYFGKTP